MSEGRTFTKVGTGIAGTSASGGLLIVAPPAFIAYMTMTVDPPHPHLPASHKDYAAYGPELGLVVLVFFVAVTLVARRIFPL